MALLQKAYLGAVPLFRQRDWFEDDAELLDDSGSVTVTANSSAHTKGAWAEVIASSSSNASLLVLLVNNISAGSNNTATLIDIATGASGSETVILSNIAVGAAVSTSIPLGLVANIPLKIASGTRLSARIQSVVTGGKTASVRAYLFDAGDYATAPTSVDVIGGNTANSQGISFSGALATWVEAISSTAQAYRAVAVVPSTHDAVIQSLTVNVELGVGAAGSETALGQTSVAYLNSESAQTVAPYRTLIASNIAAGSRLAVRNPISVNPDRYGFTLIGIP
jgi:hypothetical protein